MVDSPRLPRSPETVERCDENALEACDCLPIGGLRRIVPVLAVQTRQRVKALRSRAAEGDPKAQFNLASAYYRGKGVPQDYAVAFRWYKMAADQGEPDAEDGLGYMYVTGRSTKQDYAEALRWYKRAPEHGNAKGQFDLATVYLEGVGVARDYVESSRWFRKAADQAPARNTAWMHIPSRPLM